MLCLACKFKSDGVEITQSEFDKLKQDMINNIIRTSDPRIPDDIKIQIAEDLLPYKTIEEFRSALNNQMNIMKKMYSIVIYCKAKKSVVVGNPDKKTQAVTECPHFQKLSG